MKMKIEEYDTIKHRMTKERDEQLDEIIALKMTISGLSNTSEYKQIQSKKEPPSKILFKGPNDPLSNLYMCPINIYTHKFHSTEAAYQYRKAIFANEFKQAENILTT